MRNETLKLSRSLRRYIRKRKMELRRHFGLFSPQEQEFLKWVRQRREEKLKKIDVALRG